MLGEDGDNVADESEEGGVRSASEDDDDEVVVVGEFDRKAMWVRGFAADISTWTDRS
jgi:hypothetical protein